MRTRFDEQLETLHKEMITMGALCEEAIARSARALENQDLKLAATVPDLAGQIAHEERDIESLCLKLLLQQQPVASDLRTISSALKMVTDMERIGNCAHDIADILLAAHLAPDAEAREVHDMALDTIRMVTDCIDAFVKKDAALARAVVDADDTVDAAFVHIKSLLLEHLRTPKVDGEYVLDLLMVVKYLERIGDHAVNIARWVLYSLTGKREQK